ncbi:MAG TPA: mechanosensitive ion channel family protein [Gemmatimonadales bacterium]|nr:mechanosensitive ion channel family protein [Gemmatimonadales bacterium]
MTQWLELHGLSPDLQNRLLATGITVVILWALRRITLAVAYRRVTDPWGRYRWRKGVTYATLALGIFLVGRMWFAGMQTVATFFGLLSAGLAIALKDPVSDLAAWAFILWRRPFEVGDRIQIGQFSGDVIDVRLLQFTLNEIGNWVDADQSTGRIIHIPNGRVFTEAVANYDKGFKYIWHEVPVVVTYESNWRKAKELLTEIAFKHAQHLTEQAEADLLTVSRQYLINYTKLTPIVYTKAATSGVQLTLRYLIEPRKRRGTEHAIWEDILTVFADCPDIDLAYPTTRSFKLTEEGKPGAQPPAGRGSPTPPVRGPGS